MIQYAVTGGKCFMFLITETESGIISCTLCMSSTLCISLFIIYPEKWCESQPVGAFLSLIITLRCCGEFRGFKVNQSNQRHQSTDHPVRKKSGQSSVTVTVLYNCNCTVTLYNRTYDDYNSWLYNKNDDDDVVTRVGSKIQRFGRLLLMNRSNAGLMQIGIHVLVSSMKWLYPLCPSLSPATSPAHVYTLSHSDIMSLQFSRLRLPAYQSINQPLFV